MQLINLYIIVSYSHIYENRSDVVQIWLHKCVSKSFVWHCYEDAHFGVTLPQPNQGPVFGFLYSTFLS